MGFFLVFADLSEVVSRFWVVCGALELLQRPMGDVDLVSFRGIALHFCIGLVSADRLDFVKGASRFCQTPGTSLTQTVR